MENKKPYELDDWVGAVRSDPRNTDQLTVMQGYLGASSEPGHIRVYADDSLNGFVEVPEDAIVHAVKMSPAESSLGGSKLWLRADAVVMYGDPKSANRPRSTFLEGDIMQQYSAFGGQPDTTQMTGFMGGQPDTTQQGGQFMATALCGSGVKSVAIVCPVTQPPICLTWKTRLVSQCSLSTCFQTICSINTCSPIACGGITRPIVNCPITCITITRVPCFGGTRIPCGGGTVVPPWKTITDPTIVQTIVGQPGVGFMGGQPDTTQQGGYYGYGAFNPYM